MNANNFVKNRYEAFSFAPEYSIAKKPNTRVERVDVENVLLNQNEPLIMQPDRNNGFGVDFLHKPNQTVHIKST